MNRKLALRLSAALAILWLAPHVAIQAQDAQAEYNRGLDLLYKQNRPTEALAAFENAAAGEPDQWSRSFMVGYTLRNYLKRPADALPHLERAVELVSNAPENLPYQEVIQCYEQLNRLDDALQANQNAQAALRAAARPVDAWFQENLAWLYIRKGDPNAAMRVAPADSWVSDYLADRTIAIDWNIRLTELLRAWGIADTRKIRLTLPVDRPYQKLKSAKISFAGRAKFGVRRSSGRGNNFLELDRKNEAAWPETIRLQLLVDQSRRSMLDRRPVDLAASAAGDAQYAYASENRDGLFSLDNDEFRALVREVTAGADNTGEKVELALNYLRANYRYGDRPQGGNVFDWWKFGTGDCGNFTYIAIGMLRALDVPVRGMYGIGSWNDPPPALPHSIIEIYDASTKQWFPHDPQVEYLYGTINPDYVPFTVGNPRQDAAVFDEHTGAWDIDTTWFYWNGSGAGSLKFDVRKSTPRARGATPARPALPDGYKRAGFAAGPPPGPR